jgi:hypothetical protein
MSSWRLGDGGATSTRRLGFATAEVTVIIRLVPTKQDEGRGHQMLEPDYASCIFQDKCLTARTVVVN